MQTSEIKNGELIWHCPGCDESHMVPVEGPNAWEFNGDIQYPTLSPSIKVTGVEKMTDAEYEELREGKTIVPRPFVCHSFLKNGVMEFLSDSTHSRAGQSVALEAYIQTAP